MTLGSIELQDGRVLETWISGPEGATPLLFHHGTPGVARPARAIERAVHAHGLRFVASSRPGYGGSTRVPGRTVADAATDAAALLDSIGADRAYVAGWSGGGPHALACAARLPQTIGTLVIAGVAPYGANDLDWLAGMGQDNLDEFGAAFAGEADVRAFVDAQRPGLLAARPAEVAESMRSLLPDVDREAFTDEFGADMTAALHHAVGGSADGWVDDDLAFTSDWGFALDEIASPVHLWQGEEDLMVPFAHGRWLAEHVPGADAHLRPAEGHFSIALGGIDRMLDGLLAGRQDAAGSRTEP